MKDLQTLRGSSFDHTYTEHFCSFSHLLDANCPLEKNEKSRSNVHAVKAAE